MDPHVSANADPDYPIMFEYLTSYRRQPSGKFEVVGALAEKWTRVDDTTIDFTLRRGVRFHDGSTFDAAVAAWNIERMMTNPRSAATVQTAGIAALDVLDPQTLRVKLDKPNATLLVNMSFAADAVTAMTSQQHVTAVGDERAAFEPVGTGPFRFDSWAQGSKVRWTRFEDYWARDSGGQALPFLDSVESILQANDQTAQLRLRSGDIQIVDGILGGSVPALERDTSVELIETPWAGSIFTLVFNARPSSRFAGDGAADIRRAVFHAIDGEAVAKVVGKTLGEAVASPIVKGQIGYSEEIPRWNFDPDLSRRLLERAGVADGLTIPLEVISRGDDLLLAQLYQQMLSDVGINLVIQPQDKVAWTEKVKAGNFELGSFFGRTRPDPDLALSTFVSTKGKSNYAGLSDKKIDEALGRGRSSYDEAVRQRAYEEVQQLVFDQA